MCTAISERGRYHLFGRTLDLELSYIESVVLRPRNFAFEFRHEGKIEKHSAIIGIAHISGETPLYYDAMNEEGLCAAGLNFPGNAVYNECKDGLFNLAAFEVIPFILSKCKSVGEARELLKMTNITGESFAQALPTTPLHFIISDKYESITVEPLADGLRIYDNPFGVLTNNPPFNFQVTHLANFAGLSSSSRENTLCPKIKLGQYSRGMGAIGLPGDYSSTSRFVRAVFAKNHTTHEDDEAGEVNRFFHIMDTVSVPKGAVKTDEGRDVRTVYTSCGCFESGRYYYTTYEDRTLRSLAFSDVSLDTDAVVAKRI